MLRPACIMALVLLQALPGVAQRVRQRDLFLKRGMFGLQGGLSAPVMDFADDHFRLASGYATAGYCIKATLQYDVGPHIGLALQYQFNKLPFNSSNYLGDLREANGNYPFLFNAYTSDPWTLQGMMAGVYYPLRTFRTTVDVRLLGGFLTGALPKSITNYTYIPDNSNVNLLQHESTASGLGFSAGLSIRYRLYKSLLLLGSADFTYTDIEYTDITATETHSGLYLALPNYTQYYHIISVSAGIGVQFD